MHFIHLIENKLANTSERSVKVLKNIVASFILKGWVGIAQLLLVPLTLSCLSNYEYGVWMTISTMLVWIDSMDIGLGNGMRNMLATFRAEGNNEKAKQVVSTCFFSLFVFMLIVGSFLYAVEHYIDFYSFLNIDSTIIKNLTLVIQLSTIIVCATFVFKFVGNVYLALQLPAVNNLFLVLSNTMVLIALYVAQKCLGELSLLLVALISTMSPLLVFVVSFPFTFIKRYPELCPSIKSFRVSMLKGIFYLGIKFFLLQLSGILLFSTSNIIISHYIDPLSVTPYQVAQRYFNIILVLFTIIVVPLWSATTDAYARKDYEWIKMCGRKGRQLMLVILPILIVMSLVAPYIYSLWTLDKVTVSPSITWIMALYMLVTLFSLYYAHLLYGMGKIYIQMWVTLIESVLFIPLAIFGAINWNVTGVISALTFVNLGCCFTNYYQFYLISHGKAKGLWQK